MSFAPRSRAALPVALIILIALSFSACSGGTSRSAAADAAFASLPVENLKPTRWDSGDTTISNEARLDLFRPALEAGQGGIYVGVGGLQNFTLAAWHRSERIFLMDFTRPVVIANRVQVAFIRASETGQGFRAFWERGGREEALAVIKESFPADQATRARQIYLRAIPFVQRYLKRMDRVREKYDYATFYDSAEDYAYIRKVALAGRIQPVEGNLLGAITLRGVGTAARGAGSRVRVLYLSNAEEYFPFRPYPRDFIDNVLNLPVDDKSVAIRTVSLNKGRWPWAPGSTFLTTRGFHYGVQKLSLFQEWLRSGQTDVLKMFAAGRRDRPVGLTHMEAGAPRK